ncbi:unnamed protein product, partial [Symbiodinium sp. KB8]
GLCFFATVFGVAAGLWNYSCNLYKFWAYQDQPVYEDVDPSANALSFLDAGELHFTQGAAVDVSRAFTHRGGDGTMLCLAPITDSRLGGGLVQFWAVGVACCDSGFHCGDVLNADARGGSVLLEDPLYAGNMVDQFRKAALTLGGQSAPDALFVIWAAHPSEIPFGHWRHGVAFMLCACGLHLALSVFLGFAMHFGRRGGKPRQDLRPGAGSIHVASRSKGSRGAFGTQDLPEDLLHLEPCAGPRRDGYKDRRDPGRDRRLLREPPSLLELP